MKALDGLRDVFAQLLSEAPLCDFQKQQYLRKWNAEIKHIEKTYNINCKSNTQTEVVRCEDCKWNDTTNCQIVSSLYGLKDHDFCSYGER